MQTNDKHHIWPNVAQEEQAGGHWDGKVYAKGFNNVYFSGWKACIHRFTSECLMYLSTNTS
jgi:hypothetical protein